MLETQKSLFISVKLPEIRRCNPVFICLSVPVGRLSPQWDATNRTVQKVYISENLIPNHSFSLMCPNVYATKIWIILRCKFVFTFFRSIMIILKSWTT